MEVKMKRTEQTDEAVGALVISVVLALMLVWAGC